MDLFIQSGLGEILQDPKYHFYIVRNDLEHIVAMFVYSNGFVIREKDEYSEIAAEGSLYGVFDNGQVIDKICYQTIEIDYLAVQEEYRNRGIGSTIVSAIAQKAKTRGKHFLTVDAYHEYGYSAIPFYEKNQFIAVSDFIEEQNTLRMFRYSI